MSRRQLLRGTSLVLVFVAVSGCYSTSLMQDTRAFSPGQSALAIGATSASSPHRKKDVLPELNVRVGVAERLELQIKTTWGGTLDLALKHGLTDDRAPVRLSLLGGAQFATGVIEVKYDAGNTTRGVHGLHGAPLVGFALGPDIELLIAPDVHAGIRIGEGRTDPWLGVAGHVAMSFNVSGRLTLIPECSLLVIAAGPPSRSTRSEADEDRVLTDFVFTRGDVHGQCGLSFKVGSQL